MNASEVTEPWQAIGRPRTPMVVPSQPSPEQAPLRWSVHVDVEARCVTISTDVLDDEPLHSIIAHTLPRVHGIDVRKRADEYGDGPSASRGYVARVIREGKLVAQSDLGPWSNSFYLAQLTPLERQRLGLLGAQAALQELHHRGIQAVVVGDVAKSICPDESVRLEVIVVSPTLKRGGLEQLQEDLIELVDIPVVVLNGLISNAAVSSLLRDRHIAWEDALQRCVWVEVGANAA